MLMLVFDSPPHFGMSLLLTKSTFGVSHLPLLLVVWLGLLAIKRLVMHPLSKYPGPRLAALTPLYKSYYEVIKGGRWLHHVDELHKVYGEIALISSTKLILMSLDFRRRRQGRSERGQLIQNILTWGVWIDRGGTC